MMAASKITRIVQDLDIVKKMHVRKWKFEARHNFQIENQVIRTYFNYRKKY